tara:strand:+ start:227256 stop:228299 length:1044 start_codon:yes stop_codon:yes gene_type:complete
MFELERVCAMKSFKRDHEKMNRSPRLVSAVIAAACCLFVIQTAVACQIPVFRYALERWASDKYDVVILHKHPLSEKDQSQVAAVQADSSRMNPVNANVRVVNVSNSDDPLMTKLWSDHGQSGQPIAAVLYPEQAEDISDRLAQVMPLAAMSRQELFDSPARTEIAKRLLAGESAVWIFVPCGHPEQDAQALATLKREIRVNEERLELPSDEELESDDVSIEATHIELRIAFSILTVDRDDPREQLLVNTLMRSESDLQSLDQPMAFPVLGRGRVLYALVGQGISTDTIAMASSFVAGPCSCQVKNLNPGFDLLLSVDWEEHLAGPKLSKELPDESAEPILLTIPPGR